MWGHAHCLRVCVLAEHLAREEGLEYDAEALRLASLLHDIGLYRAYDMREGSDHAQRSMAVAAGMLRDGDYPADTSLIVLDTIEHHPPGASPVHHAESDLLKDAVALDYLGSVGLSRVFAMVGLEDDVPDLPTAFRHARSLRRILPDLLRLGASRELARKRVVEMDDFFVNLERDSRNLKLF